MKKKKSFLDGIKEFNEKHGAIFENKSYEQLKDEETTEATETDAGVLFYKFFDLYPDQDAQWIAQKAALIMVDEMIKELSIMPYGMQYLSRIDYWEGIKQEINKY